MRKTMNNGLESPGLHIDKVPFDVAAHPDEKDVRENLFISCTGYLGLIGLELHEAL